MLFLLYESVLEECGSKHRTQHSSTCQTFSPIEYLNCLWRRSPAWFSSQGTMRNVSLNTGFKTFVTIQTRIWIQIILCVVVWIIFDDTWIKIRNENVVLSRPKLHDYVDRDRRHGYVSVRVKSPVHAVPRNRTIRPKWMWQSNCTTCRSLRSPMVIKNQCS